MPAFPGSAGVSLSAADARHLFLSAQGFGGRRTAAASRWPQIDAAVARMGLLQIDSVNVLVRSHYLPVFSRIGAYPRAALDARAFEKGKRRAFFEFWAHEASLLPLDLYPLMKWRMRRAAAGSGIYGGVHRFASENADYVAAVRAEIVRRGALAASELDDPGERSGPWWGWHKGKTALEYLFWTGEVTTAFRRGFERVYDLPERVLPAEILSAEEPREAEAIRLLVARSASALGVATEADLRDYFRLPVAETRQAIAALVEDGVLLPAAVEGWRQPAFFAADAQAPGKIGASALLSPFDPLVWHRPRTERIFDFHYRLEFYTPGPKRVFGYFVMPLLYRGALVGRVDLKADRAAGVLRVPGVFLEPKVKRPEPVVATLAAELVHLAGWLELGEIAITGEDKTALALSALL
ncbi:hypothetical protein SAMN02745157_0529 [Kaistia soli DSM 19436]|uniref:Winged helix-turn-helix domain-containing protein n=1 Tax=Kaistia soli DSM 19436 TaxID=1122133 RepID=A0A1M4UT44_9HYPH|nr:winged helix-turn-helix domain-containing protein [Kaistia soli]SHE59807.1 hypothetical protein SAMN02745157_0529 [Kaistia soli DSM 19436]